MAIISCIEAVCFVIIIIINHNAGERLEKKTGDIENDEG